MGVTTLFIEPGSLNAIASIWVVAPSVDCPLGGDADRNAAITVTSLIETAVVSFVVPRRGS